MTSAISDVRGNLAADALQLIELTRRWRIAAEDLLAPLGLDEARLLADSQAVVTHDAWLRLLERARELTGEPAIGIHLGLQQRVSAFGYLGLTTMSAPTLGDALGLATQFAAVLTNAFDIKLRVADGSVAFVLDERADFKGVRDVVLTSALVGLATVGSSLTGRELPVTIDLVIDEPPYYRSLAAVVPPMRFGQPVNQLVADASVMEWKLATADRLTLRLAREQCQRDLDALRSDELLLDRVRRAAPAEQGFRTIAQVATTMRTSTRTLKRRLAEQGVTFSSVVDSERRDRALLMLRNGRHSVTKIAQELGYASLPAFIRAFTRWTGTTPAEYRRRHLRAK